MEGLPLFATAMVKQERFEKYYESDAHYAARWEPG
jgi:hypothetical protein